MGRGGGGGGGGGGKSGIVDRGREEREKRDGRVDPHPVPRDSDCTGLLFMACG